MHNSTFGCGSMVWWPMLLVFWPQPTHAMGLQAPSLPNQNPRARAPTMVVLPGCAGTLGCSTTPTLLQHHHQARELHGGGAQQSFITCLMRICTHILESTMARGWWSRWYQGLGLQLNANLGGHVVCLPPCWLPTKACGMPLARSCVETLLHTASQAWHLHGGGFTPSCGLVVLPLKGPCRSELPKSNSLGIVMGASQGHG